MPTLSFCITCKNRFHQISQTLPRNLSDNEELKDSIDFVLVDFGSTDGLRDWIVSNFMHEIESGYLKYYYTEELKEWHVSVAKNTAHMLADNRILVNLDCDNYTGRNGGAFVINTMMKYGPDQTILHQFSNHFKDGSYGRIALTKGNFLSLRGYDESLMPSGYADTNLLQRFWISGGNYIHFPDRAYNQAISNTKEEGLINVSTQMSWREMNYRNLQQSKENITTGKLIANTDKEYIGIIDNIYTFVDDD